MSELVDPSKIEDIVGVKRHIRAHWARAVSKEETVYILHSQQCVDDNSDLRRCEYSLALDAGIDINEWILDVPLPVRIYAGKVCPAKAGQ